MKYISRIVFIIGFLLLLLSIHEIDYTMGEAYSDFLSKHFPQESFTDSDLRQITLSYSQNFPNFWIPAFIMALGWIGELIYGKKKNEPNQARQPTTMLVTDPAAQALRQAQSRLS